MLISSRIELQALLPANVSSSPESLLTLIEQTERSYIVPILGAPLYSKVTDYYHSIMAGTAKGADGKPVTVQSLVAAFADQADALEPMQTLIKLLQVPLVYMTLANRAGMLAVSFNNAGINVVSADNFEPADKESRASFSHDCFMAAHQGIEQVLIFLENDAHSERPVFIDDWRQSASFYQTCGLLLSTATEFNRFVSINESRETFLSLVPRIQYMQDYRIRPQIGDTLIDALIQYATFGPQPYQQPEPQPEPQSETSNPSDTSTATDPWQTVTSIAISSDAFLTDLRPLLPVKITPESSTPERVRKAVVWNKLLSYIRTATALYVEAGNKKMVRPSSENEAMQSMERAKLLILSNHSLFEGLLDDCPLPIPKPVDTTTPSQTDSPSADNKNYRGGLFDPFDTFYN